MSVVMGLLASQCSSQLVPKATTDDYEQIILVSFIYVSTHWNFTTKHVSGFGSTLCFYWQHCLFEGKPQWLRDDERDKNVDR